MESPFEIVQIDPNEDTVTVKMRGDLIGPVADSVLGTRKQRGRVNTRHALGQQLFTARRILRDMDVDPDCEAQLGGVTIVPLDE